MNMSDWTKKLDGFLALNDRDILTHAGKVSHQIAKERAEMEYDNYQQSRLKQAATDADIHDLVQLESIIGKQNDTNN